MVHKEGTVQVVQKGDGGRAQIQRRRKINSRRHNDG